MSTLRSDTGIISDPTLDSLISYLDILQSGRAGYASQVWNRFNWFLTLQLAIVGFFLSQADLQDADEFLNHAIPALGVIGSLVWLLMGYEDYVSLRRHGLSVDKLETLLKSEFAVRHADLSITNARMAVRFRQNWLLFIYPLIFISTWVFIYCQTLT